MEEADSELVNLVAGGGAFSLGDNSQVAHLAGRLTQTDNAMTATRQNFLVDASTPHGDVVISDSAVQKPGIGWVTLHVTEAIKSGVHEWSMRVENQGETSDGSGLMLGIVPKNYSRFDSFISQGSGWCLSRAGKFYGHWRRVDDNTSVSSLIFGTGDRVVFELDYDAARMTVRVGDRFVVGEISNLATEVYPAISLHYRHQHVKFEYHKVRDRNAKHLSWIDRGIFPSAVTMLPITRAHLGAVPLDLYLFALAAESPDASSSFEGEEDLIARTSIIMRSFGAVQRFIKAGFVQLDQFLPASVSAQALMRPRREGHGGKAFASSCGSLLLVHMLSQIAKTDQAATITMASSTLLASIAEQPLLAFAPSATPEAHAVCVSAIEGLRRHISTATATAATSPMELLAILACQSGCLGNVVEAAAALLSVGSADEAAVSPPLGPHIVRYIEKLWPRVHPRRSNSFAGAIAKAERAERSFCADEAYGQLLSAAAHGGFVFVHGTSLAKIGTGLKGTTAKVYASTSVPQSAFVSGSCSSIAVSPSEPNEVLLVSDMLRLEGLVAAVYDQDLHLLRTIREADSNWPSTTLKVCSGGGKLFLATQEEEPLPLHSFPYQRRGSIAIQQLAPAGNYECHDEKTMLSTAVGGTRSGFCVGLSKDSSVEFGNIGGTLFPEGYLTVELWVHLLGRDEQRAIYQHGDKTTTGEIFLDTYLTDGAMCIRGGCRYEIRGAKIASVQAPLPLRSNSAWHHVALVFDGRWRLFIDGEEGGSSNKAGASQMFIESPKGRWAVGNGAVAQVAELRVWRLARTAAEIHRDATRALSGGEAGLLLYAPMSERSGCVVHDHSSNSHHGWVQGAQRVQANDAPVVGVDSNAPASTAEWPFPRLDECHLFCSDALIGVSYEGQFRAAPNSAGWITSVFQAHSPDGHVLAAAHSVDFGKSFTGLVAVSHDQPLAHIVTQNSKLAHVPLSTSDAPHQGSFHLAAALKRGTLTVEEGGLALLAVADAVCVAGGDGEAALWSMVEPFSAEVTVGSVGCTLALLKDHYRTVQSVRARKAANLKTESSPYVIGCVLHVLRRQLQVALQLKIHPANLDLVVGDEGTSTGSQLLTVLSDMLNDAEAPLPATVLQSVARMLQDCVPLLYPSVPQRARLMKEMLQGQWSRKASQYALLYGLVANLGSVPAVVSILKSHDSAVPMEEEVLSIATLLLDDSVNLTLRSLGEGKEDSRVAYKHQTMQALGTLQLLLFSRCRDETTHEFNASVGRLFEITPPPSSPRTEVVQAYLERLMGLSTDVLRRAGSATCSAAVVSTVLSDSIVEKLLLSAVICAPLLTNEHNCSTLIDKMDALLGSIGAASQSLVGSPSATAAQGGDQVWMALGQLEAALVSSIAWIASSMSTMQHQRPPSAAVQRHLGHPLLLGGLMPLEEAAEQAKAACEEVAAGVKPEATPAAGGPGVVKVSLSYAAAALHLSDIDASAEARAELVRRFLTGPQLKLVQQKLLASKSDAATVDFDALLAECEAKCELLLRIDGASRHLAPQFAPYISDHAPPAPNRWKRAFLTWKRAARTARQCALSSPASTLSAVLSFVDDFIFDTALTATEAAAAFDEASRIVALRIEGTSFIRKSLEGATHSAALQAAALYTRAPDQRCAFDDGVEGCRGHLRTRLRSNIYGIIRRFQAPANGEATNTFVALLRRQWAACDYAFLQSIDAPATLFAQCTLFDGGSALKPETHAERARRLSVREKKRSAVQEDAPKASALTGREKQLMASWEALKDLAVGCVAHLSTKQRLNVVERRHCQQFLHRTMTVLLQELVQCVEYGQQYCHPAQDRLVEHIGTICSFLSAVLRCAAPGTLNGVTSLGSVAASVAQLLALNVTPPGGSPLPELCMRVVGLIFEKSRPALMDLYFDRFLPDMQGAGPQLPCGSACAFLFSWASRCGSISEGVAQGAPGRALRLLHDLLSDCPHWEGQVSEALTSILGRTGTMADVQATDEQRREAGLLVLSAVLVIGGVPAEVPQMGSRMRQPESGSATLDGPDVFVIDTQPAAGTATVIDAGLHSLTKEREAQLDSLVRCPPRIPEAVAKLGREIAGSLRSLLENWLLVTNTLLGGAVGGLFLRLCAEVLADSPAVVSIFASEDVMKLLNCGVAQKLVLSPLPVHHLVELSTLVLGRHLHPQHASESLPAPDLNNLAKMEHMMQQAPAAPAAFYAGEARRARKRSGFESNKSVLSPMLLLCDPSGGIDFEPVGDRAFPTGATGLTVEMIVAVHDQLRCTIGSGAARWDRLDATCRLLHLRGGEGSDAFVTVDIVGQHLVVETTLSVRSTAMLYRTSRDCSRKVHLVLVLDGTLLQLYKDGDLCLSHPLDAELFDAEAPLAAMSCGQMPDAASSEAYVALSGLRLWGVNIQSEYIRSIAEIVMAEDSLPAVALLDVAPLSFRFLEGVGDITSSDDVEFNGRLVGNVRWAPAAFPSMATDSDLRFVDDIQPEPSEFPFVPRKEWQTYVAALEPSGIVALGSQLFASMSAHFSRQCVRSGIRSFCSPQYALLGFRAPAFKDLCGSFEMAHCAANLLRYSSTPSLDEEELDVVTAFAVDSHLQALNLDNDSDASDSTELLEGIYHQITAAEELYQLEMHYPSLLSSDNQLFPLLMMHGGAFTMSFDGPARSMDYLYVFADRLQKVHIAKFPDSQGTWPELELTHASWLFLKPTSNAKSTPARCTIHGRSLRPAVGERLLMRLLRSEHVAVAFNQNFISCLVRAAVTSISDKRLLTLRCLTMVFDAWRQKPTAAPFCQCPLHFLTGPLSEAGFANIRRDVTQGTLTNTPSMTHCRLVQHLTEMSTAAIRLEAAWCGSTPGAMFRAHADRLHALYRSATEGLQWHPSRAAVSLAQCPGMSGGVSWRRRANGSWLCTCDRSWQTVRADVGLTRGRFYFEVRVSHNSSAVCVGLVTKQFRSSDVTTSPLGCDVNSWCFDGSRLCRWHGGIRNEFSNRSKWKARDVIGIYIDLEEGLLSAMHNGKLLGVAYENLTTPKSNVRHVYYPAISFNPSGCEVNFGAAPFVYDIPQGHVAVEPMNALDAYNNLTVCNALIEAGEELVENRQLPPELLNVPSCADEKGREGANDVTVLLSDAKAKLDGSTVKAAEGLCVAKGAVVATEGRWYFEVLVQGDGMMQVGWVTPRFSLENCRGRGLGDDANSWAVDGCRMLARHNKQQRSLGRHPWRDGDIIGCMVDCADGVIGYLINGTPLRDLHDSSGDGTVFLRVAASGGVSPAISVDPNSSATILFAPEELTYTPKGYRAIGGHKTLNRLVQNIVEGVPSSEDVQPCSYARYKRLAHLSSNVVDLASNPVVSLADTATRIAGFLDNPDSVLQQLGQLQGLTQALQHAFPFIPGCVPRSYNGPLVTMLRRLKPVLLSVAPIRWFQRCLAMTNGSGEAVKLTLNRRRAMTVGKNATSAKERLEASLFGQIALLLGEKSTNLFITNKKLWSVVFAGEGADDVGGPYRESIAEMCAELMSDRLPLFQPSANQQENTGEARDRFVTPYELHDDVTVAHYSFIGRIIGGCLRSGEPLPLYFPSLLWKAMAGDTPATDEDLAQIDASALQSLEYLRTTDDAIEDIYEGGFVTTSNGGKEVPLFTGGENIPVAKGNVEQFVRLSKRHKLHVEGRAALDAIIEGFHAVVPPHMLSQLRWQDLETAVCGRPDFDVSDLRATVRYEDLLPTDRRVHFLWQVLTEFTCHERALFMRFVSGRERHPVATLRLKLMASAITDDSDDQHLPHASTCFYWLSLPNYSTVDVMRTKLLYAVTCCQDIDADFRVRDEEAEALQPRAMVRSDQEDEGEFEDYSHLL